MFSIVIPLYNKAHSIERTLKTVFNQTYSDYEIVIVNDGSTDDGVKRISELTDDKRVRIINQENQGVSSARNKGVEYSSRDFIAFLDGDDEWLPDYLQKIKEAIELYPNAGMFCCAGIVRNADGTEMKRLAKKYSDKIVAIDFFENPHVFLHTSAAVVSKSQFKRTKGFPTGMRRNQDYALFFSLALITPVVYCGTPLSIYVGGVMGQATSTPLNQVLPHVVNRFNLVFNNWTDTSPKNQTFITFMMYELRQMFLVNIRKYDFASNLFLVKKLNPSIVKLFSPLELMLIRYRLFKGVSVPYLLLTKIIWRLNGYPYLGQK